MVDIVSALPRTVTEIDRIEAAVRSLAKDLHQLTGEVDAIHHGTNARVDLLARLDLTKSNMQVFQHCNTFSDFQNWLVLVCH
jgi:hypothetical protein